MDLHPMRTNSTGDGPSYAAVGLASRIDEATYRDVYAFAREIDKAFERALAEAVEGERARIYGLGPWAILKEYWQGKRLRRVHLEKT